MWATRPEPRQHFWKIVGSKNFWLPAARFRETTCVRFGKAGAHPQLAWESQLPLKPCILIAASRLKRQLRFFRFPSRFLLQFYLKVQFAPQMWATRPHLASIFEKLLDQKTFGCLWLVLGKPLAYGSARLGHIPSLPGNRNCPWNLISHYILLIFKAIAILSMFS